MIDDPRPLDVLVVGGCAIDCMMYVDVLPVAGHSVSAHTFLRDCGGKGFNQAVAAARLGARSGIVASVGTDAEGDEVTRCRECQCRIGASALAAARAIHARGARQVAVGLAEGRAIVGPDYEQWLRAHDVLAVDTTGAGDACAAGIAVGLAERRSPLDACSLGHAAAALATTQRGARASLPSRARVEALLRDGR